jgi:5-methylcytosine-specific restriction protein B
MKSATVYSTLIDRYKRKVADIGLGDETYKWEWIAKYKGWPNLNSDQFLRELQLLTRTNLIYQISSAVLVRLAKLKPLELKSILSALYDESIDLQSRINAYRKDAEELYVSIRTVDGRNSHQDERTISALLALRYPDRYPIYKEGLYQKLCNQLGRPLSKPGEKYVDYIYLMNEFVESHIRPDAELIELVRSELPENAYTDPNFLVLAQDILYQNFEGDASNRIVEPDPSKPRVWLFSPGSNASKWAEFQEMGIASIGWGQTGDISPLKERSTVIARMKEIWPEVGKNDTLACFEFAHVMKPGDFIITKRGRSEYIGVGKVRSSYRFDSSVADDHAHVRDVTWLKAGSWIADGKLVMKTLTDITKYPDYVRKLKQQIGFDEEDEPKPDLQISADVAHWWLNANPKYWDLSEHAVGSHQTYTTHAESGNKRRIYKYFEALKPGDLIIGYETTPRKRVVARLVVTQGIHQDEEDRECIEFRVDAFYANRPTWEEMLGDPVLSGAEVFGNNQGSLFKLTPAEFAHIEQLAIGSAKPRAPYTLASATSGNFLDPAWLEDSLELWHMKKNLILQGPPGTGKTFVAKRLAWLLMGEEDESRLHLVQFHPSYSYEDFIEGYRPDGNGGFVLKSGHFLSFCKRAASDPERPYVFVIDEINRGNLSKVFGEVMMGIEADKRGESIHLQYARTEDPPFRIPENVHLIGTMNTADRSLALVDYALRRRFAFKTVSPVFDNRFIAFLKSMNVAPELINRITTTMTDVNRTIEHDPSLGIGYAVGHSYFCAPPTDSTQHENWLNRIWRYEVVPLMEEYWFDQTSKIDEVKRKLGVS